MSEFIPPAVYGLCALTSLLCMVLLWRSYRRSRERLLLMVGLCFAGLAINNVLLFMDFIVFVGVDLSPVRGILSLVTMASLLFALILEGL